MTEVLESNRLIELVIDKHNRFIEAFNSEFSELENKLKAIKQQSDAIKKEMEETEARVAVLNEKYHLVFHQAKKQREEVFNLALEKVRGKATAYDIVRLGNSMAEFEKKLQTTNSVEDEEKTIGEVKKLLYDFESVARSAGIAVACKGVIDRLNEANSLHKELLALQSKPKWYIGSAKDFDKQIKETEERYNWLKRRIESHNSALDYWEKQKGGIRAG
jgi:chromosome segregation ATPase